MPGYCPLRCHSCRWTSDVCQTTGDWLTHVTMVKRNRVHSNKYLPWLQRRDSSGLYNCVMQHWLSCARSLLKNKGFRRLRYLEPWLAPSTNPHHSITHHDRSIHTPDIPHFIYLNLNWGWYVDSTLFTTSYLRACGVQSSESFRPTRFALSRVYRVCMTSRSY